MRPTTGLGAGADGLTAGLVARTGFDGFAVRVGGRLAAARFGGAIRLADFLGALARFDLVLAGLAPARPFRDFRPVFLEAAPAARRAGDEEEERRFGRVARLFLAMSV